VTTYACGKPAPTTCRESTFWVRGDGRQTVWPISGDHGHGNFVVSLPELPDVSYQALSRFPTEPHALLKKLGRDPLRQTQQIFGILGQAPAVPPRIGAALFRALALIPGTHLVGHPVKDALGRTGTAIDFALPYQVHEYLILNPKTYAFLGTSALSSGGRTSQARKVTGVVDHPRPVPRQARAAASLAWRYGLIPARPTAPCR
jgi:hypothetical protein